MYTRNYIQDSQRKCCLQQEEAYFHQEIWRKFKHENTKILNLERNFVWCSNLDTSESVSTIPRKFWSVLLEKDGDQLDQSMKDEVKENRSILHIANRKKTKWIAHNLRRNCFLKHVIEGPIEGTERQERRCQQLLNDFKDTREY